MVSGIIISAVTFHTSYAKVDRFTAKYPDNDQPIVGNVYYPKYSSYSSPPIVVYIHGLEMQKDLDARVPMEFCRRGFIVLSVDLHGHGEADGVFGPKAYQDGKDAIEYVFDYLDDVANTSRLAVVGHSAGGLTTLGLNDTRIMASVTWASPVYYSVELIERFSDIFTLFNPDLDVSNQTLIEEFNETAPYSHLTPTNPQNLLAIHHVDDPIVNVSHAYAIHNKTQCELLILNDSTCEYQPLSRMKEYPHGLMWDCVMRTTINWIENSLGLPTDEITDEYFYRSQVFTMSLILTIIGLFGSAFSGIHYFGRLGGEEKNSPIELNSLGKRFLEKYNLEKRPVVKKLIPFLGVPLLIFIGLGTAQLINSSFSRYKMNLIYLIPSLFLGLVLIFSILTTKLKFKVDYKGILFGSGFAILLLGIFIVYTLGFHSFVIYPHYAINVLYASIFITLWVGISSIVLWKMWIPLFPDSLLDPLSKSSKATRKFLDEKILKRTHKELTLQEQDTIKLRWKVLFIGLVHFLFNMFVFIAVPFTFNTLALCIVQLVSSFTYGVYYHLRRNIAGIAVLNALVLIFFYSTCYWFFPNFP